MLSIVSCANWLFVLNLFHFFELWLCHKTCRISVPWPGTECGPQQWKHRILTPRPPGSSLSWSPLIFLLLFLSCLLLDWTNILYYSILLPLEKEMAIYLSILAWKIPWTEEPGGLQSRGCRVTQDRAGAHTHTHTHTHLFIYTFLISHLSPHTWNFSLHNVTHSQTCDVLYPPHLLYCHCHIIYFFFLSIYLFGCAGF